MATKKLSQDELDRRKAEREAAKTRQGAPPASPGIVGRVESLPENGTVTVGCKLPQGLILTVSRMVDVSQPVLGGGVQIVKVAQDSGKRVVLKGTGRKIAQQKGAAVAQNEFALTHGVPADFYAQWLEQHADSDIVKNDLVFAVRDENSGRDKARDLIGLRTGFEGLTPKSKDNPKGDARIGRPTNPQLTEIETLSGKETA